MKLTPARLPATRLLFLTLCVLLGSLSSASLRAQPDQNKLPGFDDKTAGMKKYAGYFDYFWSADEGKIYLAINEFDKDFLYVNSLAAGLGSNDIGLDRNQLGDNRVVQFRKVGPKVLLVQHNLDYRAVSDNPDEVNSVRDAFAQSILYGFKVVAQGGGRVLIDLTPMLMSDAHGVINRLKRSKQGNFKLDGSRSAVYLPRTRNFPKNSEFEATLTFTGEATGRQLRSVTPTSNSFTLRMHHSLVQLPDENYEPRQFDPRCGYFQMKFADYATPINEPLVRRFITRHRLEKKDPTAAMSDPVEPIIYYLDRGAPEPIRSALLEGGRWWNDAFEQAGYRNAFQVKILPEGADPLDVRYNVINWVHRSTRGWSYGSSVIDPRTGEIIKGHVLLGSLRVRQDYLLAQGLIKAYATGDRPDPRLEELALARLRQLSAHEIGHTIGLAHNFAASAIGRASVMDYPHPYVQLKDGKIDVSEAYDTGMGAWDVRTILYGYQDFPNGTDVDAQLKSYLNENERRGLHYLSDADARPAGSSHPLAHLWDNGTSPVAELDRLLNLRNYAIAQLGPDNLAPGQPLSELEKILTPVYLMHRYQVEAVAKQIAGYYYSYEATTASGIEGTRPVPAAEQSEALAALLKTLEPRVLTLPKSIYHFVPPPAMGYGRDRELFRTNTGGGLDPLAMAGHAAHNSLNFMLHPDRLARVQEQHALYPGADYPALAEYLQRIEARIAANLQSARGDAYQLAIAQEVQRAYANQLVRLAGQESGAGSVRAASLYQLQKLRDQVEVAPDEADPHQAYLLHRIETFLANPSEVKPFPVPQLPDGSPIGCGGVH